MKDDVLLKIANEELFYTGNRYLSVEKDMKIRAGVTVLTGENGAGKSTFAQILEKGRHFRTNKIVSTTGQYPKIKLIEFNDIHSLAGLSVEYYQQRYESGMNNGVPTVAEILRDKTESELFQKLKNELHLEGVEAKKANYLSSGELRKLLIINALLESPDILILDNPYIGLDSSSRIILNDALKDLKEKGSSLMLILPDGEEIPDFNDHIINANALKISTKKTARISYDYKDFNFAKKDNFSEGEEICKMTDCNIKYETQTILDNFNWVIKKGERWSLSGPNGSGKSTLLSLLNADNPKAYSNDIKLFGKRRGSGESIWDIKKRIGYVSPEMQLHFHGSGTILEIIANGLNDTVGMYVRPTEEQKFMAEKWLRHFNLEAIKDRKFHELSSGEKQMVLIARSFIKEPELLILDEPMHALDSNNQKIVKNTIKEYLNNNKDVAFIMVTHRPENLPEEINRRLSLTKLPLPS